MKYIDALSGGAMSSFLAKQAVKRPRPLRLAQRRKKGVVSVMFMTWERDLFLRRSVDTFLAHWKEVEPQLTVELVIVDNGSKNQKLLDIINSYKWDVRVMNKQNLGISQGVLAGIRASRGEYFICLEDDWETTGNYPFLRQSCEILRSFEDIGGVRLSKNIQSCLDIDSRVDGGLGVARYPFDNNKAKEIGASWRGKEVMRGWLDVREAGGARFFTWTNSPSRHCNAYSNGCFLAKSAVYDWMYSTFPRDMSKMDLETKMGSLFGSRFNAAMLVGGNRFRHLGEKARVKGNWHE